MTQGILSFIYHNLFHRKKLIYLCVFYSFCTSLFTYSTPVSASLKTEQSVGIVVRPSDEQLIEIESILKAVLENDQKYRNEIHSLMQATSHLISDIEAHQSIEQLWQQQKTLDKQNQAVISELLSKYGWPERKWFKSTQAKQIIFLVIQHAPVEYQQRYFPILVEASERGDIPKGAVAIIHDKILISRGEKQRYGTQIKMNDSGEAEFYPIEDEPSLALRRKVVSLPPIAEYAKLFGVKYDIQAQSEIQESKE